MKTIESWSLTELIELRTHKVLFLRIHTVVVNDEKLLKANYYLFFGDAIFPNNELC